MQITIRLVLRQFKEDIELQNQTITFSGTGAHHQNGVAERAIKTCTSWALSMMMHQLLHWPDSYDESLWPFALDHAVFLWNHLPKSSTGPSPHEIFTGSVSATRQDLQSLRVWGCPAWVLDPRLQDGKKIPKWHKRSRLGVYLGVSGNHSTTVGRILNTRTGYVSPQYHVVYDELFTTVRGYLTDALFDEASWSDLTKPWWP